MRTLLCLLTLLPAVGIGFAQPLNQGERDRAMSELHATRKQFLDAVAGLSDNQWNFKPAPNSWSIAECALHIAQNEDRLFEMVTHKIVQTSAQPQLSKAEEASKDELLLKESPDLSRNMAQPRVPHNRWRTRQALIDHFKQSRDRTIAYVRDTQDALRSHFAPYPGLGKLDAYQWILAIGAESFRYVEQIEAIKADTGFPEN